MDIEPDLIKEEPEFADFTESIVNIKSESEYNVSMDDNKTEREIDIENQINETSGTTIKQELDDEMWKVDVKKEVPEVKGEPSSDDNVVEKLPEIKTEEVMLKNEREEDDSETGYRALWDTMNKSRGSLMGMYGCDSKTNGSSRVLIITKSDKKLTDTYYCPLCIYKTTRKDNLKVHMVVHDKNSSKKFGCHVCDFRTHYKNCLREHILLKHEKTLARKYCCDHCDYKTTREAYLKNHMTMHDPNSIKKFVCHVCDYRTHRNNRLMQHIRVKHDKNAMKKYACDHCSYRSIEKSNLKRHMVVHYKNVVHKYCCNFCNYRNEHESKFKNHILTKHNNMSYLQSNNITTITATVVSRTGDLIPHIIDK